jgi:hypothetical protein
MNVKVGSPELNDSQSNVKVTAAGREASPASKPVWPEPISRNEG